MTDKVKKNKQVQASELRHDLKNPLTTIIGYSELLASKLLESQEKEKRWAKTILAEAKKMLELIDTRMK